MTHKLKINLKINLNSTKLFHISFKTKNVVLYFEINIMTVYSIDVALDKMISDFEMIEKEVNRLIEFNPEKITGKFRSITFIFDDEENVSNNTPATSIDMQDIDTAKIGSVYILTQERYEKLLKAEQTWLMIKAALCNE